MLINRNLEHFNDDVKRILYNSCSDALVCCTLTLNTLNSCCEYYILTPLTYSDNDLYACFKLTIKPDYFSEHLTAKLIYHSAWLLEEKTILEILIYMLHPEAH
jgi:hypothetical protein